MRRKDNRGASFVMVIAAMAIVAILAVTILWIALANLQMKTTDEKTQTISIRQRAFWTRYVQDLRAICRLRIPKDIQR